MQEARKEAERVAAEKERLAKEAGRLEQVGYRFRVFLLASLCRGQTGALLHSQGCELFSCLGA